MNTWEFIDSGAGAEYTRFALESGADLTGKHDLELVTNIGDIHEKVYKWALANREKGQMHANALRDYHVGDTRDMTYMPTTVGYDLRNTGHVNFGLVPEVNEELKELIGGREAFDKMGLLYEHSLCRLMLQPPGFVQPFHADILQNWRDRNPEINPHMVTQTEFAASGYDEELAIKNSRCDLGEVRRYIVAVTPWHWGHIIMMKNSITADWKSGDVFNSPPGVWHLTANAGVQLRMSMTISGVAPDAE